MPSRWSPKTKAQLHQWMFGEFWRAMLLSWYLREDVRVARMLKEATKLKRRTKHEKWRARPYTRRSAN